MSNTDNGSPDRVTVDVGLTINLGDYNSLRVGSHYGTDVKPGESLEEAYDRAWALAEAQVEAAAERNTNDD